MILATFSSCCCSWSCNSFYSKSSSRMGKHHGSEGRKSLKIAPVTPETHNSSYFFPPPAAAAAPAAAPALATPSIQKTAPGWENTMAVKDGKVSKLRPCCCSCSCNSFYSKDSSRMGKHHGSEGRKSIKIAPKNS